ncbi:MAG: hypothetical protein JSR43_00195, partial [Proteobacteria bacterium]|nr:hypothetical protein [Pseudomonadota bacterium]
ELCMAAARGEAVQLMLCGERRGVVLATRERTRWQRLASRLAARWAAPASPAPLLESL